ncbi:MAG: methyltransferase [Bacteroidales bacterium]|nr:methyltransferase [Bacteroidales bacterium]
MNLEVFNFRAFKVYQHEKVMKVNTDGVLLGVFSSEKPWEKVLEVGCGLGYISLMLAQKDSENILAIDINPIAVKICKLNFLINPWHYKMKVKHISLHEWVQQNQEKIDLIVTNPPYFVDAFPSPNPYKRLSRHSNEKWVDELIYASSFLTYEGQIHLAYPFISSFYVEKKFFLHGLHVHKQWIIRSFRTSYPYLRLLSFSKIKPEIVITENLIIQSDDLTYTEEYKTMVGSFLHI